MLEIHGLSCERGERLLFEDLSFSVRSGELLRIAGVNGSGKTTLLRLLCGLALPDEGEIRWDGKPVKTTSEAWRRQTSYLGHNLGVKLELTPLENLAFARGISGLCSDEPLDQLLDRVGLYGFEYDPCRTLSQGQRRRVALARLMFTRTPLWILDEPFVALDTAGIEFVAELLKQQTDQGGMVILTTHQDTALQNRIIKELSLDATAA